MKKFIILLGLLLASCSVIDPIPAEIQEIANNREQAQVFKSIASCPTTKWTEEVVIGTSVVKRDVLTECDGVYLIESLYRDSSDRLLQTTSLLYRYRLLNYNVVVTVGGGTGQIYDNGVWVNANDYIKTLNKR